MARSQTTLTKASRRGKLLAGSAEQDLLALGITLAAIVLFIGTGGAVMPKAIASLAGYGIRPDKILVIALLLNIGLIIFGWRRYRDLEQEVQARRHAEEQARTLAETDALTGCLNRRSFGRNLESLIAEAADKGLSVAIMMIDLDNFKQINDFHGHAAGDQILITCAERIRTVMAGKCLIARIGGDEFACAMEFAKTRPETVDRVASQIVENIGVSSGEHDPAVEVTASVGITRADTCPRNGDNMGGAHYLLDMADIAMYHAKRQGRNTYFWFEDHMADQKRLRSEIEAGIRQGIAKGEFVPFYEQQIDVQTSEVTGFEMLARWISPQFGTVKPDIFIPIAENIGVIAELSEGLIARALQDAKQWDPKLTLAVNISPLQLRDPWFSQKLLKMLVEANFPPHRLEIEVTESCVHEDIAQVRALITSLKNQGVRVSLDDFGTGYSSLAQLRSLPFDRIKIDRSFVTSLAESTDNAVIVDSIAMLGKGLGLPITAEGIETLEILEHLRTYGEIKGQGYLYGQPKSADETHIWLSEKGLLLPPTDTGATPAKKQASEASPQPAERLAGNG